MSEGQQSPPGQRRSARNRERNINLRKYYGIGASAGETRQPYDIDGSTFEPNKYFARLLKEKSLNGLVAKDNELVAEIREIDGDMKTLVYENYNKFISATDTIRKMKSNVENMESEMRHLDENVSSISKQCAEISQALGPNREKIKRLTTAHNMLKRLQFMFDLPNRLNYCLANRQYAQAVKYYTRATRLLEHYHHMAAFKGIERDCIAITEKIKMQLWENMAGKDTVTEAAKLLLSLNEDKRKVWKRYLEVQDDNLKKESEGWDSITVVQELKDIVLVRLDTTVTNFKDLFLQEQDTSNIETAQKDLVQVIKPYLEHFFKIASVLLDADSNTSSSDDAADSRAKRMQILTALRNAISDHGKSLSMTTDIDARMNDFGALWETQLISSLMQYTTAQLKARTFELATLKLSNDLNDSIVAAESWLLQCIEDKFLGPLHKCLQAQPADEHRRAFTDRVRESLGRLWLNVLNIFSTLQDAEESNRELALLLGSRLCYYFGENGIERVYGNYPDFSSHDTQASITDNFLKKGQSLLNEKVMEEGYDLSRKIQHHYINSRASVDLEEKPTQVSSVWQTISNRLGQIEHVVETIYPQQAPADGPSELADADFEYRFHDGLYTRPAQSTHSLATAASDTQGLGIIPRFGFDIDMNMNMMSNIDKLFAERVDIYRQVEPTPAGVVSGLLHILLKTFYETVRLARVQTSDYQQVQIDVEYLRFGLWPYAQKENKWMESMLQEIVSSAYLRCPEPVPLEHEDMERILSPYYSPTSNIVNTQQNEQS